MSAADCAAMAHGSKYGLTCGFWTDSSQDLDEHVFRYHMHDWDVYDVEGE